MKQGRIYVEILNFFYQKKWSFFKLPCIFKKVKNEMEIFRQSWKKYFLTFLHFNTVFFHHKWKRAGLLPEGEYASCITISQTSFTTLGIFKKISNIFGFDEDFGLPPIRQVLTVVLQNCKKSAVKHCIKNRTLLYFVNLSAKFFQRL